jgi:hypothetical protein
LRGRLVVVASERAGAVGAEWALTAASLLQTLVTKARAVRG